MNYFNFDFFLVTPGSQLYQFLLQLLDHQEHESIIKWIEKQNGVFQIVNKEKLAELWGKHKQRKMTYESLSRALRYYYKVNILKAVPNKLRYKFTSSVLEEWERIRHLDRIPL